MKCSLTLWLPVIAFLWTYPVLHGHPSQLPEIKEATDEKSSTCYGTLKQFQPSCTHRPGTVIGVQAVKVGAKRKSLGCPDNVPDDEPRNDTCCSPNSTTDCIQVFDYMKSFIPDKYKFHTLCSGYPECFKSAETVWAQSDCGNNTVEYMKFTNYQFMEFSCIEESRIGSLCSDNKYSVLGNGSAFYLHSPEYPYRNISADIDRCICHVQASSNIKVYTVDLRLYGQTLSIADSDSLHVYDETNATIFNVTSTIMAEELWVTFNNTSNDSGAYVWVGFEAMNLSTLTISCKVYGADDTDNSPSPSSTPTTNMVPIKPVPHTTESLRSSTPTGGFALGVIIGITVGLLCLLVIILVPLCYFCKRKTRNPDGKRKQSSLMHEDKESEISGTTRKSFYTSSSPMNEKFKSSNIPQNKVEPTRYIEEHGGIRANPVLPSIGRSTSRTASDKRIEGTRYLPPLKPSTVEVIKSVNEETVTEYKRKKKSKKHRSHKRRHEEENNTQESETDREPKTAAVNGNDTDLDKYERRHSRKRRHRIHSNTSTHNDYNVPHEDN
ncbi:uncharacterized protein LOC123551374 [Mercenaria mercenaria]|uniref:uncharacterized protein LOC123551374 n=1 Tax=Mercenaria mercenaria TaxID=6596 RepID=UPI00234EB8C1|nr:uncharacterized protein LOC123551374 [Mercenaria mercenaria]